MVADVLKGHGIEKQKLVLRFSISFQSLAILPLVYRLKILQSRFSSNAFVHSLIQTKII